MASAVLPTLRSRRWPRSPPVLRAGLLPEAWIAPAKVRQLRALLRHRISLVRPGTQLRNRIHAVAADHGYDRPASYWTGPGRGWLAELDLPPASREIVTDCLTVIDGLALVIERIDGELHQHAKAGPRVKVVTTLPAVAEAILSACADMADHSNTNTCWLASALRSPVGTALEALSPTENRPHVYAWAASREHPDLPRVGRGRKPLGLGPVLSAACLPRRTGA